MKHIIFGFAVLALMSTASYAQFRINPDGPEPSVSTTDAMKGGDNFLSTIFDPARFSMHQSYSMGFVSGGGGSVGLTMFTNTFSYKASDNLFISADVSAAYSPFSSFGSAYSKSLDGIYLSSARLDWKLGDNTFMRIEYVGGPQTGLGGYGYNPFYGQPSPFATTGAVATVKH